MANERDGTLLRSVQALFGAGTFRELTDAQLLDRFISGRDGFAETAFEALMARHAPMVRDVCRNVLHDIDDAQDAFQATFLILACRARSIRRRESVASWLFGVARRVASRAKTDAARRRAVTRKAAEARPAQTVCDRDDRDYQALHEEVARLPETYRAPVVLCYLEGMTYEAAARLLGCPLGTLSVRLRRARERLRTRLIRRGVAVPAGLVCAERMTTPSSAALPAPLVESTVRAAVQASATRAVAMGVISSSVVSLVQGVMRTMYLAKLKVAVVGSVLGCLVLAGTGTLVGQQGPAPKAQPAAAPKADAPGDSGGRPEIDRVQRLVEAARRNLDAQRAYYEEGRITIDRYLAAHTKLLQAEQLAATTDVERLAAAEAHLERVKQVEEREQAEANVGRSTTADLFEAALCREEAELAVKRARDAAQPARREPNAPPRDASQANDPLAKPRLELARKIRDSVFRQFMAGEVNVETYLTWQARYDESVLALVATDAERVRFHEARVDGLKKLRELVEQLHQGAAARMTRTDVLKVEFLLLDAEAALAKARGAVPSTP